MTRSRVNYVCIDQYRKKERAEEVCKALNSYWSSYSFEVRVEVVMLPDDTTLPIYKIYTKHQVKDRIAKFQGFSSGYLYSKYGEDFL